jgi:hypothetical protein
LEFSSRVHVYACAGRWLASVPPRRAAALLGKSAAVEEKRGGRVVAIRLLQESPRPYKAPTPISLASYGQRYVYREVTSAESGHRVFSPKRIHSEDRDIFRSVVIDCMGL